MAEEGLGEAFNEVIRAIARGGIAGLFGVLIVFIIFLNIMKPLLIGVFPGLASVPTTATVLQGVLMFAVAMLFLSIGRYAIVGLGTGGFKQKGTIEAYTNNMKRQFVMAMILVFFVIVLNVAIRHNVLGLGSFNIIPTMFSAVP